MSREKQEIWKNGRAQIKGFRIVEPAGIDGEVTIVKFKKFDPTPLNHFEVRDKIVSNLRKEGYPDIADSLINASFEGGTPLEVCCILWGKLKVIQKKRYDFTALEVMEHLDAWQTRPEPERVVLFLSALLHDIGKSIYSMLDKLEFPTILEADRVDVMTE